MITRPNNWEKVQEYTERKALPLGAYVCKIRKAAVQQNIYGDQLCVLFDIAEGTHKGWYDNDYKSNQAQDKKWRGVLRLWLPVDDGSEKDEITKRTLKGFITAVEKSNPGYVWNWDELTLAGRTIGVLMRNEEWAYNGKTGWAVRPFRAISADKVRNNEYTLPTDKRLSKPAAASTYNAPSYSAPTQPSTPYDFGEFKPLPGDDDVPF